jgi:hypothetical protein
MRYEMSFSFVALGNKAAVRQQVEASSTYDNAIGEEAKKLVLRALEDEDAKCAPGYEYGYIVKVNGHSGGGSPTSLVLSIEAQWIPTESNVTA